MEKITKEDIQKLLKVPGEVKGQVFVTDFEYVKEKKGKEGIKILKEKIKEWGELIDYEGININQWYPMGLRVISLLAIKEAFGFGEKEIKDLGESAPKFSFLVKVLLKYFVSTERSFKESPNYWSKHYSVGKLEPVEFNESEKYAVLRLRDFKIHPILCNYLLGYFLTIAKYTIRSEKIEIEEKKCMFKGDPYHEFFFKWE